MRRLVCVAMLGLLLVPAASAKSAVQSQDPVEVQEKRILAGFPSEKVTIEHWGEFTIVTAPLSSYSREFFSPAGGPTRARSRPAMLGVGLSISRPSFIMGISTIDFAPLEFANYYYYWVVVNSSSADAYLKTKATLRGPGRGFAVNQTVRYPANTIVQVYTQQGPFDRVGIYKFQVKVAGATGGQGKVSFCGGCL